MAEVKWVKITTNMFDDEKINYIEGLPDADAIILIWVRILTLAGKCNAGGFIMLTEKIPYTEEMLSHKFKKPLNTVRLAIETFKRLEMITGTTGGFYVSNWEKHQNESKLEEIREIDRTRKRELRKKNKLLEFSPAESVLDMSETMNGQNTESPDTDIDIDIDKDIIIPLIEKEYMDILKKISNYPFDFNKDIAYLKLLETRYPQLDIIEVVKNWAIYKLDNPIKKKDNPRSQLNTQCQLNIQWGKCLKKANSKIIKDELVQEVPDWFKNANY